MAIEQTENGGAPVKAQKLRVGRVISNKMAKTVVVEILTRVPHPLYEKIVKRKKKFYVHDEQGTAQVGDLVQIKETRPLSKLKRWVLVGQVQH